jgi:hypothetical protein
MKFGLKKSHEMISYILVGMTLLIVGMTLLIVVIALLSE